MNIINFCEKNPKFLFINANRNFRLFSKILGTAFTHVFNENLKQLEVITQILIDQELIYGSF